MSPLNILNISTPHQEHWRVGYVAFKTKKVIGRTTLGLNERVLDLNQFEEYEEPSVFED